MKIGLLSVGRLVFRRGGQLDPKTTACTQFGFNSHSSAHSLDALLDDGQANAGACISFYRMQPLKRQEDALKILAVHSNAVVLDPEPNPDSDSGLGPEAYLRGSAGRDKFSALSSKLIKTSFSSFGFA